MPSRKFRGIRQIWRSWTLGLPDVLGKRNGVGPARSSQSEIGTLAPVDGGMTDRTSESTRSSPRRKQCSSVLLTDYLPVVVSLRLNWDGLTASQRRGWSDNEPKTIQSDGCRRVFKREYIFSFYRMDGLKVALSGCSWTDWDISI